MFTIKKTEGSFSKLEKPRYRLLLWLAHVIFRREDRFVHFLKSIGMDDLFCVRALERCFRLSNKEASVLIAKVVGNAFNEPKAG